MVLMKSREQSCQVAAGVVGEANAYLENAGLAKLCGNIANMPRTCGVLDMGSLYVRNWSSGTRSDGVDFHAISRDAEI